MIGSFERFELTLGSFGEQRSTIDGTTHLTWFDLMDPNLKGLEAGAKVEYDVRPGPTVLCGVPRLRVRWPKSSRHSHLSRDSRPPLFLRHAATTG